MLAKLFHRSSEPKPDITDMAVLPWSEISPRTDFAVPPWIEDGDTADHADDVTATEPDDAAESTATTAIALDAGTATTDAAIVEDVVEPRKKLTPWQLAGCSKGNYYRQKRLNRLMTEVDDARAALAACQAERQQLVTELAAARAELKVAKQAAPSTDSVPIDDARLLAVLGLCGVHNADTLRALLALPAEDFAARMRAELTRRQSELEVLQMVRSAQMQQARVPNVQQ